MKKLFLSVLVLIIVFPLFSQNPVAQITDYFPVGIGNTWTYANASGKTTEVVIMKGSMPDNVSNDGTSLYLFERQFIGIGTVSTLYSIKQNKALIMVEKNVLGQYQQKNPPSPILAPAGQEWRYNDRGDDLRYRASTSSCSFDGKTFNDCILVEERIVNENVILRTKKSYYAKNIGLIYVTLQSQGENESVYQKLSSCNFIDIENIGIDSEYDKKEDSGISENNETEIVLPKEKKEEEVVVDDNLNPSETRQMEISTEEKAEHFAGSIGYIFSPELPIGFNFWFDFDRFGFYFSFCGSSPEHTDWPTIDDSSRSLEKQEDHLMDVIFGLSYRIINNLFVNVGAGMYINTIYGLFNVQGETNPVWCNIDGTDGTSSGFVLETGLMYAFKWFYLSAGYRQYFNESYTPSFYAGAGFRLGPENIR